MNKCVGRVHEGCTEVRVITHGASDWMELFLIDTDT